MPDRDPSVGELLEARTPPQTVEPRWDDVLRRAGATRRSIVRLPRWRWLVLAAVLAVPVGIAAAQAHHGFVRYFSGGVSGTPRRVMASAMRPFVGHIQADLSRARHLVTVSVGGDRHAYFLAPLTHGNGGCYFEIVNRVHLAGGDCGYDPKGRYPVVRTPAVGEGTIFGARTVEVSQKPIWVILGDLPAQRKATSVRVRFQDGTSERAATNGPYFSYVVSGGHTRAGHRPTALVGLTNDGKVVAIQQLDPSMYSLAATERRARAFGRMVTLGFFVASVESGLPRQQIRAQDRVSTTPAKLVQVFGGTAATYPPHPVVFVLRGPFDIPTYLGGCASTASVCPVPVGRWAYLAYLINPDAYHGGPVPGGAITWLRRAPIGAPYPQLSRLGHVRHYGAVRGLHGMGSAARRKHQGRLLVILHRGSRTAATHTSCIYQDLRYEPFDLCDGLSRYIAFRRTPRTDQTHSAARVWALIEGSLGGWHGCVVITTADTRALPDSIGEELRRGIWGGRHVWHPAGTSPTATPKCRR
jgi:hypothetical protein